MWRREFIVGLGSAAASPAISPLAARGQQAERVRRIGVLVLGSPDGIAPRPCSSIRATPRLLSP
jgi:hypothetical protein